MKDLVHGGVYRLKSRNLAVGVWHAERKGFIGIRTKFAERYLFTEFHIDGDYFPTATPLELLDVALPPDVSISEYSDYDGDQALFDFLEPIDAEVYAAERREEQVAHIKQHQQEFNEHQVSDVDVDVAAYFHDAGDYTATYVNLCNDLGILPYRWLTVPE